MKTRVKDSIKPSALVFRVGSGRYVRYGRIGGWRERARGEYRFSSLVKPKKKEKNYAVFYFTGERNFFIYMM
jgi:hypothetical protein